jgi:hypothetical protein
MQIADLCEYKRTPHMATCQFLSSASYKLRIDSGKQIPSNNAHLYEFNKSKSKGKMREHKFNL